jgi:hypothetical protein
MTMPSCDLEKILLVTKFAEEGTGAIKNWNEARAASEIRKLAISQRALADTANNNFDELKHAALNTFETAAERNQAETLAASYATDTSSRVAEAVEDATTTVKNAANAVETSAKNVARDINGVYVVANSLADRAEYFARFTLFTTTTLMIQVYQGVRALQKIGEVLGDIKEEMMLANSLQVQGSSGDYGFARHVYDFVQMKIDGVEDDDEKHHCFFVYHPDTNWYPAFRRLVRQNPLPPSFCGKSDNLDKLCQYMQSLRESNTPVDIKADKKARDEIKVNTIFHVLIPAWAPIAILEPLHFPQDLQPLLVEGLCHQGRPYVALNLPAAPRHLLNGVLNVLDPSQANARAEIVSGLTAVVASGWGANGAALALGMGVASIVGGGPFVFIPLWIAGGFTTMPVVGEYVQRTVYESLAEERPRVLGSNDRI